MRHIIDWIIRVWLQLKIWYRLLLPIRFSFIAVTLFAVVFILVPQGEDALRYLDEAPLFERIRFFSCALFFAVVTWYVSRQLLHVRFPGEPEPPKHSWIVSWTPRLLGAEVLGIVAYALYHASVENTLWIWIYVGTAVLFLIATAARRAAIRRGNKNDRQQMTTRRDDSVMLFPLLSQILIAAVVIVAVAFFVLTCIKPVPIGQRLGAPGVAAISLTGWVAFGGLLAYAGGKMRFPIGTALVIFALLISPFADNHRVRDLGTTAPAPRPTIEQQFDEWSKHAKAPYFVVSTQGGGIRAAYWTALVLTTLDQRTKGEFSKHLFAISGVSGGSVGAAAYVTSLSRPKPCEAIDAMFAKDALGPLLAAMLQSDFAQRFAPFGFPDRARALENAWEDAWEDDTWKHSFLAVFADRQRAIPSLFMNGTMVEEGKRIIVSNCHVDGLTKAVDAIDAMRRDMPVSTAAHLSARFPYFSPVGTIPNRDAAAADCDTCYHCDVACRRVADGGRRRRSDSRCRSPPPPRRDSGSFPLARSRETGH